MQIINTYSPNIIKKSPNFKASDPNSEIFNTLESLKDEKSALLFIRKHNDLTNPVDTNGDHIIHFIVKKDFFETLKQMLHNPERARELLDLRGEGGKTPLAVAVSGKSAKLMLQKGANPYALDDNLSPAGDNEFLPAEIRERVRSVTAEKVKKLKEQVIRPEPKIDTTPLRQAAAQEEYSKVETKEQPKPAEPPKVEKKVEEKPRKSFFSMFTPKTEEAGAVEPTKKEIAEVKTPSKEEKVQQLGNEAKTDQTKKENGVTNITIDGTHNFKRIDTTEIANLDYIVGLDSIKKTLRKSVVEPVVNEKIAAELSLNLTTIPNGLLLTAPPGNGKTTLAKALGAEASMPVFEVSSPEQISQLVEIVDKNYKKTKQRAIIYMRGLDNLYGENASNGQLTNELVRTLQETAKRGSLIIFSAECSENLPKAILTPGKIDKILSFKSPDTTARLAYIERYSKDKELLKEIDLKEIAEKTQGFSIAQIKHVIDDSVLYAATENVEKVTTTSLLNRIKEFSKEQNIPEINEYNKTSMYDTVLKRYQPTAYDAEDFEKIAGMPATKSSVEEAILKPWQNADKLREAKIQLPAGGIFAGDPGTSKTYMAKALAKTLNIPLYVLKMSEIGSSFVHETSKNMGRIIDQLITKFDETGEASILLMDEIDHFQKGQSQHGAEEVNTLLQEVERGRNKILFIGTTNELEALPDSLTRDGRMGTVIHFEHCDEKAAGAIIRNMLVARIKNPEAYRVIQNTELLEKIAKRCNGMVAASVSAIINDALADTVINGVKLEDAIETAVKVRKKKDIEKMLSQTSKNAGHRLNITEDSTIMYDTKHPRMLMSETDPQKLDDLGGMQEIKNTLREEIVDIYQPETLALLKENKLPITKGFILHGPPGNGKTTIIKAIANEMKLPIYSLNTGNIGSSFIHQLSKNAQEVRDQLAYKFKMTGERSILFMDEAQQLVPRTSGSMGSHQHNIEETNFFKDMIMSAQQDGIIYAMATNDLNQIEPAFYENADRLGVCVYVGNPDLESRLGTIKKLLDDRPITKAINNTECIQKLAEAFEGLSISKISQSILNLVRDSIKSRKAITLESSLELIRKVR